MNQLSRNISSLEVAEMVERRHDQVMRDIRTVTEHLGGQHKSVESYFIESEYTNSQNKKQPCYLLTKKGCELFGTRMTGEKGTQFAVRYIERFNEMEEQQKVNFTMPQPTTQAELIAMMAQQGVEQERRLNQVEQRASQLEEQHGNIVSILSLSNTDWRNKVNQIINAVAMKLGGMQYFKDICTESYLMLDQRAGCSLDRRLENRRSKMALKGLSNSTINKVNKLDVIAEDKKLISVYITVIKEMAVKYQLDVNKYQLRAPIASEEAN